MHTYVHVLSDDELDRIAQIAEVPEGHRPSMKRQVQFMVNHWVLLGLPPQLRPRKSPPSLNFKRIVRVANEFAKMLEEEIGVPPQGTPAFSEEEIGEQSKLREALRLANWLAASFNAPKPPPARRQRSKGRPPGSSRHRALYALIGGLHNLIVEDSKGKLTVWQSDGKMKGSLPTVLEILRPHLSHVVPRSLNEPTLRRAVQRTRQNAPENSRFIRNI